MNPTLKRYLISSAISFFTGFVLAFLAGIDVLSLDGLKDGSVAGLIVLALRGGLKAALEGYLVLRGVK